MFLVQRIVNLLHAKISLFHVSSCYYFTRLGSLNWKAEVTMIDVTNPTVMTELAFAMVNLTSRTFRILGLDGLVISASLNNKESKRPSSLVKQTGIYSQKRE